MNRSARLLARREAVVCRGVPIVTRATVASARGAILVDEDGREIIDFAGGIGVMTAGHSAPEVVKAIAEQSQRLQHTCIHLATYEPYVALCEKLVHLFPHGNATRALLVNSGAEAVENAVKIARQATSRPAILCYSDGFHGRTLLGMSLTSKVGYKTGCGPFAPEIYRLPFPNHFRDGFGFSMAEFAERELNRLQDTLINTVAASDVAAILIETVQGEGGFVSAPEAYLCGLRRVCDEHGIVLIFDEVQTGFCRTGKWASYEHFGVVPDLSTWAKAMGGGLPIAAVVGRASFMDAVRPGTLGGTYGGNPVACAAALATIGIMERDDLNSRSLVLGRTIHGRFQSLAERCPWICDVRGIGAMMAIELFEEGDRSRPAARLVSKVIVGCLERGLLVISAGIRGNVIRILAPLVITDEELDRGLTILESEILRQVASPASKKQGPGAVAKPPLRSKETTKK